MCLLQVPPQIGDLPSLTELDLESNRLSTLPSECTKLTKLAKLYLSRNQFTSLPSFFGTLKTLEELFLNNNRITDLTEVVKLVNLRVLNLSSNSLQVRAARVLAEIFPNHPA